METELLEAQILFTVIVDRPSWIPELLSLLQEQDFIKFGSIYRAVSKLYGENKTIDHGAVLALAKQTNEMTTLVLSDDNLGNTIIPNKKTFDERVEILKELSAKKQISESFVNELDLNALKEKLEQIYRKGQSRWLTGEEIKELAYEILKNKIKSSVTYHSHILNTATGGLEKGQYTIVAGRPSVGKSAFLQFTGLANAEKGKKVLFVSAEMGEEMIIQRILTTYKPETIPTTFHILIASDTATIESEIYKKGRKFDLVLIDYIQLLKPKIKTRDLYERITNVSSDLKSMATKFNLPFLCASQFSRKAEGGQPTLADLKESGALEQDADVVISLWRSKQDLDLQIDKNKEKIRIDLLKNRNGYTFVNSDKKTYALMFKKDEFKFFEIIEE